MSFSFQRIFLSSLVDAIKEFCKICADKNEIKDDNNNVQEKRAFYHSISSSTYAAVR